MSKLLRRYLEKVISQEMFVVENPAGITLAKSFFLQEVYDALVLQRTDLPENGFFPRYRA